MKNLQKVFKEIGKKLVFEFKRELEQQGHRASKSGSIIDGLRFTTSDTELRITTDKAYAAVLNNGSKDTIPYRSEQEKHKIAYAIIRRIKLEGTPTKGAFKYTDNGRRTGFIEQVINTNRTQITKDIQAAVGKDINILFTKLPKQI